MKKRAPGCLWYIGDEKLPNYMGIIINQDNDPYYPTSIMESRRVLFCDFENAPYEVGKPHEIFHKKTWISTEPKNSQRVALPDTNSSPLKIDPWKRRFLLETIICRGYVSFREYKRKNLDKFPTSHGQYQQNSLMVSSKGRHKCQKPFHK